MPQKIRITAIGGSIEPVSSTKALMELAVMELTSLGADVKVFDIKDLELPFFRYQAGKTSNPEKIENLLTSVRAADGFLFASPEYHGTISGAFKNVMDYLEFLSTDEPPYITGKPAGLIAVAGAESAGSGTLNAMMNIVHSLRGVVVPGSLAIGSALKLTGKDKEPASDTLKRRLKRMCAELYRLSEKLKD
jgi:FMN reductase